MNMNLSPTQYKARANSVNGNVYEYEEPNPHHIGEVSTGIDTQDDNRVDKESQAVLEFLVQQ